MRNCPPEKVNLMAVLKPETEDSPAEQYVFFFRDDQLDDVGYALQEAALHPEMNLNRSDVRSCAYHLFNSRPQSPGPGFSLDPKRVMLRMMDAQKESTEPCLIWAKTSPIHVGS